MSEEETQQQTPEQQTKHHSYEKCFDMPFAGASNEKHISRVFARIIVAIVGFVFKILWRFSVTNRESLNTFKDKSGVVVVCNHTSYLDTVFLYLSVRPELWPRFIARDPLFTDNPSIFGWALAHLGVFPIKRDSADRTAIKRASTMLKNKEVICIFPEGTRRGKGSKTPEIHGGAALIARMGKAPILPMTVREAENIKQKGQRIRFPKVTCEFGDPIQVSDFDFLPKQDRLDGCAWYAMRECFALSQRVDPEQVDMAALFPHAKDYAQTFADHPVPHHTSEEIVAQVEAKNQEKAAYEQDKAARDQDKANTTDASKE